MKIFGIYKFAILVAIGLQVVQAQFLEDALRYSQLGLGVGAREIGMGNATVGGVNNYSALFWNPAGLALESNIEFSFGLSGLYCTDDVSYIGTNKISNNNVMNLSNLGLVYSIPIEQGNFTYALGYNRTANYYTKAAISAFNPFSSYSQNTCLLQQQLDYNIPYQLRLASADTLGHIIPILNGNILQAINSIEGGGLNHWSIGIAWDIKKNLSIGISLNYVTGSYSYNQTITESDTGNFYQDFLHREDFSRFNYEYTVNDEIRGFNALFGLMFRKPGSYSIGFAIRTKTSYDISETFTEKASSQFKTPDSLGQSSYSYPLTSHSSKYKVTTPYTFSGGISIHPFDWLTFASDIEYTDWTQMELKMEESNVSEQNTRIKNELQATTNFRGGGEILLWDTGLKLRCGIIYNQSPWKEDSISRNQVYYTAGIGYMLDEKTTLDIAYAYGSWKTLRNSTANSRYISGIEETIITRNFILTFSSRL